MKRLEKNDGAHFDFKEVIRELFLINNERVVKVHIDSGRDLKDLPRLKECDDEVKKFMKENKIHIAPTDYNSLACPPISMDKQDTLAKKKTDKNEREARQIMARRRSEATDVAYSRGGRRSPMIAEESGVSMAVFETLITDQDDGVA